MNETMTTMLESERTELADLRSQAERGHLVPATWKRLRELNRLEAAVDGAAAGEQLAAEANRLRARGHQ